MKRTQGKYHLQVWIPKFSGKIPEGLDIPITFSSDISAGKVFTP